MRRQLAAKKPLAVLLEEMTGDCEHRNLAGFCDRMLGHIYLHWFDKVFHRQDGPGQWANAKLVRYADDSW
jgi:hypothetical protein